MSNAPTDSVERLRALVAASDLYPLAPDGFVVSINAVEAREILAALSAVSAGGGNFSSRAVPCQEHPPEQGLADLTCDFARSLPGGAMDDTTYEAIEYALDRAEAPCRSGSRWLKLSERVTALAAMLSGAHHFHPAKPADAGTVQHGTAREQKPPLPLAGRDEIARVILSAKPWMTRADAEDIAALLTPGQSAS